MGAWPFRGNRGDFFTKITSDTTEREIVPGYDSMFASIYALIITNTSATACKVTLRDGLAGNVRAVLDIPTRQSVIVPLPDKGVMEQLTKNKPWTLTCTTSVDSIEVTAFFKNE